MNSDVLKTFPEGTGKGYLFAGFPTVIPVEKVIDYIKKQGSFLSLEEDKFRYDGKNFRSVEITTITDLPKNKFCATSQYTKEIIVKATYEYDEYGRINAMNDADSLVLQIENLVKYAEKVNPYFVNLNKSNSGKSWFNWPFIKE
jgi:hypothetical protein